MPFKRSWGKQDKLTSKVWVKKTSRLAITKILPCSWSALSPLFTHRENLQEPAGHCFLHCQHTALHVRHWPLPEGHTQPTSPLSHAGCSHCSNPQAARIWASTNTGSPRADSVCLDFNICLPAWSVPSSAGNYSQRELFLSTHRNCKGSITLQGLPATSQGCWKESSQVCIWRDWNSSAHLDVF